MALENNSPTFTYIRYEGMQIVYDGVIYQIQNSHSNKKYLYWSVSNPYQLEETNNRKSEVVGEYLVIINDKGISTLPPHTDISINFDGNNPDLIADKIYGIYETVDGMGDKFVSIEQNIDGISTTVGQVQEEQGSMKQQISQIDQKADNIQMSVENVEKEFSDNKEAIELRENLNKSIIDFNSHLGIFKSEISTYFKDNRISSEEKISIDTHISIMDSDKANVILNVNKVILIAESEGQTTVVNSLNSAKNKFVNSVDNLKTYITTAISDNTIVPSEVSAIVNLFGNCSSNINTLKNTCDNVIFLGAGGSITTELARIGVKSDEILLQVSKTEESITNNLSIEKISLSGQMKDVENAYSLLKKSMDDIFVDGNISTEEKQIISDRVSNIDTENNDVHTTYQKLYTNINISTSIKNELKQRYDNYNNKWITTKNYINNAINDGFINDAEKNNTDTHMTESLINLNELHKKMSNTMDDININTQRAEVQQAKDELQGNINDVSNQIGNLNNYIDGTFNDNVLDEAERKAIKSTLDMLSTEKVDIDNKYNQLILSKYLDGQLKIDFTNTYNNLVSKYDSLILVINEILDKPTLINNTDRLNLEKAQGDFNIQVGEFSRIVNKVIEYIGEKQSASVVADFEQDLANLNDRVDGIMDNVEGAIGDGIIDEAERVSIKQSLKTLETEFIENDTEYQNVYNHPNLFDPIKSELNTVYHTYSTKYNNLIGVINGILNKVGLITDVDRQKLDASYMEYGESIRFYMFKLRDALDSISNKSIEDAKAEINQDINDLNGLLSDLENTMNGVFKDGVLSDSEKLAIKQNLQTISNEKIDVDKQYITVYNNPDLTGDAKTNLKSSYDDYVLEYGDLVNVIDFILNKVGLLDDTDQVTLNNAFSEYRTSSGLYSQRINQAVDAIANKKANDAEENSKIHTNAQIKLVNDEISLKVSKTEYDSNNVVVDGKFSEIKQTTESIVSRVESVENKSGNNLLMNTNFASNSDKTEDWILWTDAGDSGGWYKHQHHGFPTGEGIGAFVYATEKYAEIQSKTIRVAKGEKYTLSADILVEHNLRDAQIYFREFDKSGNWTNYPTEYIPSGFGGRKTWTHTITGENTNALQILFINRGAKAYTTQYVVLFINRVQLEKGETSSLWSLSNGDAMTNKFSEIKQTTDSIINTVSGVQNAHSQLTQKVDGFEFKFQNTGQPNLIPNGKPTVENRSGWQLEGNCSWYIHHPSKVRTGLANRDTREWFAWTLPIKVKPDTKYTVKVKINAEFNTKGADVYIIGHGENDFDYKQTVGIVSIGANQNVIKTYTFTTNSDVYRVRLRLDNNGSQDVNNGGYVVWMDEFLLIEGDVKDPNYRPSENSLYNNITQIDSSGVKVSHSDGTYSHMGNEGFKHYRGSNGKMYHHMSATGQVSNLQGQTSQWVDLVAVTGDTRWRNKPDLQITAYIHDISHPTSGYALKTCGAKVLDIDRINGKFRVYNETNAVYYVDGSHLINIPASITWVAFA